MKLLYKILIVLIVFTACTDERNLDFIDAIELPSNISATYNITQDNTGVVTITPTADSASRFDINFGDGTTDLASIGQGQNVAHTYAEGTYDVKIIAYNLKGDSAEHTQQLIVSFQAPQNLVVVIENDSATSKQVNVTANADFATTFDFYPGDTANTPITGNIGDTISYQYQDAGTYSVVIEAKGGAIATTEHTEDFEVTEILAPTAPAPTPPNRNAADVVSIFSDAYTNVTLDELPTTWSSTGFEATTVGSDNVWKLTTLDFLGMVTNYANGIDVGSMEKLHIDYWVPDGATNELFVKIVNTIDGGEDIESLGTTVGGSWQSIDLDMSGFDGGNLANKNKITQILIDSDGVSDVVYIDNFYFHKQPSAASVLTGTWRVASEAGALKVGPSPGSGDWWSIDAAGVSQRACYFDDTYVFNADGSFNNVLGADTWLETWQGVAADICGAPVAPHDGAAAATFVHDVPGNKITINGTGAYLGLPKANNAGELPNVAVPSSITYDITLSNNNTEMEVIIEAGSGVFWTYKLVKDATAGASPIDGTWKVAAEAGSLKVGPSSGSGDWWSIDAAGVTQRSCYFDDEYVFSNGSFSNILGADTWLETWQGVATDACGTPIAPHDGSANATFAYDGTANTITLVGEGAYLGLPKVNNAGELPNVAVPSSITYNVTLSNNDTEMEVIIEAGSGVFWTYKLLKQ